MAKRPTRTKVRYLVVKAFDYLTADREYDFEWCPERPGGDVDVRRTDGSGIGTFIRQWQLRQAVSNGSLIEVRS